MHALFWIIVGFLFGLGFTAFYRNLAKQRAAQTAQSNEASIRELQRIQEQEQDQTRAVLDAMAEAVYVTDGVGRITLRNRAAEEFSRSHAGDRLTEIFRSAALHDAVQDALRGTRKQVEFELSERDGTKRFFQANIAPLTKASGVVAVVHDTSNERSADQIRRDFVANASHELRTPVTAIAGYAETLKSRINPEDAVSARSVDIIMRHSQHLARLVEDISVLSRAESSTLEMEKKPIDLSAVAKHALDGLQVAFDKKQISISIDAAPIMVIADPVSVDQIVINLIDNALKYTPEFGTLRIHRAQSGSQLGIAIENSGPGIPSAHLGRIFERFYRLDSSRATSVSGSGLGLSIVKNLAERMGGSVSVESEPGQYTRFSVFLPPAS